MPPPEAVKDRILAIKKRLQKQYKEADGNESELFPSFDSAREFPHWPTPSATLNALCGIGGVPRGRVTEIAGPESTGKTTLLLELIAEMHRRDPNAVALFVDYEHACDMRYARRLGVDLDPARFIYAQPDYFEQGDEIVDAYVREGVVDMVCVDSVAAMIPKTFLNGDIDPMNSDTSKPGQIGLHATLMSRWLNRTTKLLSKGRRPALVCSNQLRTKLGGQIAYQDSTGGAALKYYATVRLKLDPARGEDKEGQRAKEALDQVWRQVRVRVTCIKNKVAPPWLRGAMVIRFGTGISNVDTVADLAEMYVEGFKSGAWYRIDGPEDDLRLKCQGRDALIRELTSRPGLLKYLEEQALKKLRTTQTELLEPVGEAGSEPHTTPPTPIVTRIKPEEVDQAATPKKATAAGSEADEVEL